MAAPSTLVKSLRGNTTAVGQNQTRHALHDSESVVHEPKKTPETCKRRQANRLFYFLMEDRPDEEVYLLPLVGSRAPALTAYIAGLAI